MSSASSSRRTHVTAVKRAEGAGVKTLELFFDLVFVLALTQCTALMAADPTWHGLGQGMLILGVMWWSWVGYSWLTSVIDPDEGVVRLAMSTAMGALLIASLVHPGRVRRHRPAVRDRLRLRAGDAHRAVRGGQP